MNVYPKDELIIFNYEGREIPLLQEDAAKLALATINLLPLEMAKDIAFQIGVRELESDGHWKSCPEDEG